MVKCSLFNESSSPEVIDLFKGVFSASEGEQEGQVISGFVSNLISTTEPEDLFGCVAEDDKTIVGCIFFSRFTVPSGQAAFILSPVAVSTESQGKGIGQKLIRYGLDHLRSLNVNLVFTYGNPSYYSKTGFERISENVVEPPFPLSQPAGWLAQSIGGGQIKTMAGSTQCVEALNDPNLW